MGIFTSKHSSPPPQSSFKYPTKPRGKPDSQIIMENKAEILAFIDLHARAIKYNVNKDLNDAFNPDITTDIKKFIRDLFDRICAPVFSGDYITNNIIANRIVIQQKDIYSKKLNSMLHNYLLMAETDDQIRDAVYKSLDEMKPVLRNVDGSILVIAGAYSNEFSGGNFQSILQEHHVVIIFVLSVVVVLFLALLIFVMVDSSKHAQKMTDGAHLHTNLSHAEPVRALGERNLYAQL